MSEKIRNVVAKYSPPLSSDQVAAITAELEELFTSLPEQKVEPKKKGR